MRLLLILLSVAFNNSLTQANPTFEYHPCALTENRYGPPSYCGPTTYSEGAEMNSSANETEDLCIRAVRGIANFRYAGGRSFGRFRFKIHEINDVPVSYNMLKCHGKPRDFYLKKIGVSYYVVLFQGAEMKGIPFCD